MANDGWDVGEIGDPGDGDDHVVVDYENLNLIAQHGSPGDIRRIPRVLEGDEYPHMDRFGFQLVFAADGIANIFRNPTGSNYSAELHDESEPDPGFKKQPLAKILAKLSDRLADTGDLGGN